jgi:hypothetical protein
LCSAAAGEVESLIDFSAPLLSKASKVGSMMLLLLAGPSCVVTIATRTLFALFFQ